MENLETRIQEREKKYIQSVENILKQENSPRMKIALIYRQHIRCTLAVEDMVADAQFEPTPEG